MTGLETGIRQLKPQPARPQGAAYFCSKTNTPLSLDMSLIAQTFSSGLASLRADMDHPMRTLLYELFAAPPLRLLQRTLELGISTAGFLSAYVLRHRNQQPRPVPIAPK